MPHANTELTRIIRREIEAAGPVSCARFMELALYHPNHGYYEQPLKQIGCQGDFYTSVSVGPLFGQSLACGFAAWLEGLLLKTGMFQLVEAGAHDGRLALDILSWFQKQRPDLLDRLQYWILEPSPVRRQFQSELLTSFAKHAHWVSGWDQFPREGVRGILFCNELLNAFPVYRVGWDAGSQAWFEWRVDDSGERFTWTRDPLGRSPEVNSELRRPFWQNLPSDLLRLLPDGFTVDICPAARAWWSRAAAALREGKLLTLDYGLQSEEFFAPHRQNGTLRGYHRHHTTTDPLANPGAQDLTAHVNFSALLEAGEQAGLQTEFFGWQAEFLTRLASNATHDFTRSESWTPAQTRQFHTLTHPDFLGRSFRVLLQSRSVESAPGCRSLS